LWIEKKGTTGAYVVKEVLVENQRVLERSKSPVTGKVSGEGIFRNPRTGVQGVRLVQVEKGEKCGERKIKNEKRPHGSKKGTYRRRGWERMRTGHVQSAGNRRDIRVEGRNGRRTTEASGRLSLEELVRVAISDLWRWPQRRGRQTGKLGWGTGD